MVRIVDVSQSGRAGKPWGWVLVGIAFVAIAVGFWLVFVVVPHRMVRTCRVGDQAPQQLSGRCLTTEQHLQAESNVRTAGVQALGGLVILVAAGVGASATWRGFKETRRLAIEARDHEWQIAAEERRQTRLAKAYVDLVWAVIATNEYLQFEVWLTHAQNFRLNGETPSPTPPPHPQESKLYRIAAQVDAFGSPEVREGFDAYLREAVSVRNQLMRWKDAQARIEEAARAGTMPEPHDQEVQRPSSNRLLEELTPPIRDRVRDELQRIPRARQTGVV
jgi:hypothetical protein